MITGSCTDILIRKGHDSFGHHPEFSILGADQKDRGISGQE